MPGRPKAFVQCTIRDCNESYLTIQIGFNRVYFHRGNSLHVFVVNELEEKRGGGGKDLDSVKFIPCFINFLPS
jgi:hypothetical protein